MGISYLLGNMTIYKNGSRWLSRLKNFVKHLHFDLVYKIANYPFHTCRKDELTTSRRATAHKRTVDPEFTEPTQDPCTTMRATVAVFRTKILRASYTL